MDETCPEGGEEIRPGDKLTGNVLPADYFERIGFGNGFDGIVWVRRRLMSRQKMQASL